MKVKFYWNENQQSEEWDAWENDSKYQPIYKNFAQQYFELEFEDEGEIILMMLKYSFLRLYK